MRTRASSSSRSSSRPRLLAIAFAIGAVLVPVVPALGQDSADLPAAVASPADPDAPNDGQWFAVTAEPNETVSLTAEVHNPADEPQVVSLYLADLTFDGDQPQVSDTRAGVGGWGGFETASLELDEHETLPARFTLTVPADADPGDHIGAVVVESVPTGAASATIGVVKRVATRLYVTVPGEARQALEIVDVDVRIENRLVPRRAVVTAVLRNTGTVRLEPVVTVNGRATEGPSLVMSHDSERYVATLPVSILGTRHSFRVDVQSATAAGTGPSASAVESVWIIPWWIFAAILLAGLLVASAVELRKRLK